MKPTTNDKREKVSESFGRTVLRACILGLVISVAVCFGQLKNASDLNKMLSLLFTTFLYIGGVIVFLGHYTELFFINYLRFKFPSDKITQLVIRFLYWYISGGLLFYLAMVLRGVLEHKPVYSGILWMGGVYFIGIELIANLILQLRVKKSFWNGVY